MKTLEEMLRDYDGLEPTGFEREFPNENYCGYVNDWYCRIVYDTRENNYRGSEWTTMPIIEFYSLDTNQFVSSYYVDTFIGRDQYGSGYGHGLCLQGDVPRWTIEAEDADVIRVWCEHVVDNEL